MDFKRWMVHRTQLYLYIEEAESGGVRLLRCYGDSPAIAVPGEINGYPVTEIGNYCFADSARVREAPERPDGTRSLSGEYLQQVELPDTVKKLGNLAFYNCKNLQELCFGINLTEVGSDAFMNCRLLHRFRITGNMRQETGLKQLLAQRMCSMDVFFVEGQRIVGRLFYPEYEEYHDEIGPAHIFAMSIRGEGFRARQCFREGLVSLRDYDEIFEQACAEESAETLCRLAGSRLAYPVDLEEIPEQRYREYLQEHQEVLAAVLVEEQEIETLRQFAAGNILSGEGLQMAASMASRKEWVQGIAEILKLQRQKLQETPKTERYTFEEW